MRVGVFDDMGRKVILPQPLERVVSLVPSDTETLFAIGAGDRVVARTRYCVEPRSQVESIPEVGGTKDVDVSAVIALRPDLVLANQEENSRASLEALAEAGVRVFVSFPKRFNDAIAHLARLAKMFGATFEARELVRSGYAAGMAPPPRDPISVFVPIWREPLMTFSEATYGHDILRRAGAANVFADRERQYPLKADLGMRSPLPADQLVNRDRRYPRISQEELVAMAPQLVLLPDEPHNFSEADREYFAALDIPAARSGRIHFVDGKDLFWPGSRSASALTRLRARLDELR